MTGDEHRATGGIASEFENLSGKVFEDGGEIRPTGNWSPAFAERDMDSDAALPPATLPDSDLVVGGV